MLRKGLVWICSTVRSFGGATSLQLSGAELHSPLGPPHLLHQIPACCSHESCPPACQTAGGVAWSLVEDLVPPGRFGSAPLIGQQQQPSDKIVVYLYLSSVPKNLDLQMPCFYKLSPMMKIRASRVEWGNVFQKGK